MGGLDGRVGAVPVGALKLCGWNRYPSESICSLNRAGRVGRFTVRRASEICRLIKHEAVTGRRMRVCLSDKGSSHIACIQYSTAHADDTLTFSKTISLGAKKKDEWRCIRCSSVGVSFERRVLEGGGGGSREKNEANVCCKRVRPG
jgi:hypothetical protein